MSHDQSVAVENCHSGQNVGWTYGVGRNVAWLVCGGIKHQGTIYVCMYVHMYIVPKLNLS